MVDKTIEILSGMNGSEVLVAFAALIISLSFLFSKWTAIKKRIDYFYGRRKRREELLKTLLDSHAAIESINRKLNNDNNAIIKLQESIDEIKDNLKQERHERRENDAITKRVRILRFGDDLIRSEDRSKDSYDQVMMDIDDYEDYCRNHLEFKNNITVMTIKNIKDKYMEHLKNNDFL